MSEPSPSPAEPPVLEPVASIFDLAASQRILRACAGIHSFASSASDEASQAAAPFLSFAQRSRIRALATNFESRRQTFAIQVPAPAATAVVEGGSLGRDEVEAIVNHRIEIAVQEALQGLGISPGSTIPRQVERAVETQLNTQEQRLLDYVKRHLTDSLEMLESTLDDRIGEYLDAADLEDGDRETEEAQAEVDAKVEEAREQLLKNIDEVREVEVGFDIANFASQIIEINETGTGGHQSISDGDVELGGEEGIELGGDEEIELGGDEEIELGGDEEIELGGDEEIELGSDEAIELDGEEEGKLGADEDDGLVVLADTAEANPEDSGNAATIELDSVELDLGDGEPVEEISIIQPMPDDDGEIELETADLIDTPEDDAQLQAGMELDLGEEDEEEVNLALSTLGAGPDHLLIAPVDDISEVEVEIEEPQSDEDRSSHADRYLQRASEMRNRRQTAAAMELYSKVLDLDEDNYEARIGRGVLNLESKDYKRAVEEFTRAEKIDSSRPASALGLAEVHFHRKQFNKAIRHYTQCLKLDDKLAQAYCNRGLSYYYQKNYKKAFLDLMRAYDIDSELPNIKKYLKLVRNKVKSENR